MNVSRRTFVSSAAATALFPWLSARAATPQPKLLLFFTPHGTVWDQWRPTGAGAAFTFSPILKPLEAHRSKLVILDGMKLVLGTPFVVAHTFSMPSLWTGSPIDTKSTTFCRTDFKPPKCFGFGTGVSVDQAIAAKLAPTPFRSLALGTESRAIHPANRMIYSAPGVPRNPIDKPATAFDTIFGSLPGKPGKPGVDPSVARNRSVLDTVLADFNAHKAKLSPADRQRLDAHATAVRTLENQLVSQPVIPTSCAKPAAPTAVNTESIIDRQSDNLVAALGCGLTRVGSLQVRVADNDGSLYPWLGLTSEWGGHHHTSHNNAPGAYAVRAKIYTWYAQRFAYLLSKLASTPDPAGGNLLDNTLVIWGSEVGDAYTHSTSNVPFVLAGGAGVRLKGGQYLKVTGVAHHRLLVTAFHAMGLTSVATHGSTDTGAGPLRGVLT